jgi:ribosomal protein S18 acetylase RimI-like enzyme
MFLKNWVIDLKKSRHSVCDVNPSVTYKEVAYLHLKGINQGFLSTLGVNFLTLLYESIDTDPNSALFFECIDGEVVGFVAGGRGMGSIYRQMLRRWPRLISALLPSLLSARKIKRIVEIIWISRKQKPAAGCPKAELFSIAVLESARGTGVAQRLYHALAQRFAEDGEPAFCIVVGNSLGSAHRFYKRMGAVPMGQISIHDGQGSTLYRHDLHMSR